MKRLLIVLIMLVLISGGIVGILYLNQGETDTVNMVSRAEAIAMAEKAAEKARLEASAQVPEEPKEEVIEEPKEEPVVTKTPVKKKKKTTPKPVVEKPKRYRYTVRTRKGRLHLRLTPNGKIIGRIPSGSTGYVIAPGDGWSLIESEDQIVYASNDYLEMEEIARKDYPKKYRKITAADAGRKLD